MITEKYKISGYEFNIVSIRKLTSNRNYIPDWKKNKREPVFVLDDLRFCKLKYKDFEDFSGVICILTNDKAQKIVRYTVGVKSVKAYIKRLNIRPCDAYNDDKYNNIMLNTLINDRLNSGYDIYLAFKYCSYYTAQSVSAIIKTNHKPIWHFLKVIERKQGG